MRGGGEGWRLVRGLDRTARLGSVLTQERWWWVMQHVVRALARCRLGSLQCAASTAMGSAQNGADNTQHHFTACLHASAMQSWFVTWTRTCATRLESPDRHAYQGYVV